jgi:hypothetical protein
MENLTSIPVSYRFSLFIFLSLCLAISVPAKAQQISSPPTSQDEVNRQLLQRLQELEDEVKQLKAQQSVAPQPPSAAATAIVTPPPPVTPAPPPTAAVEMPDVNEVAPRLKLEVFGDVGVQGYTHVPDTFVLGSLDLFMTARLADRISVLGEVLFIAQSDNSIGSDIERLFLRYRQSKYLIAQIGRYHTWIGYYNSTYNKAEFLETTTDRPFIYAFDDQGGVLPMQENGVNVTGEIPSGKLGLHYVIEAGNGRAWGVNLEPAQNYQDANNSKSINGGLFMRPTKYRGLQLGFSVRHDNLTIAGPPVGEMIATAHAVFNNGTWEILNEGILVRHVEPTGPVFSTSAFYTQWSRAFHKYRPYIRYQYFNAPSDDPVYIYASANEYVPLNITGFVGRVNGPSAGIRYDFNENAALKLQYDRFSLRDLPGENGLTAQVAFTF